MFGDDGIGIVGKYLVLKVLVSGRLFAEIDVKVGQTGLCEVTLLQLFGDLLVEVE